MRFKKVRLAALAAVLVSALGVGVSSVSHVGADPTPVAVYDSAGPTIPSNVASLGFQATQTSEFGDRVGLAGTARLLSSVTVVMSSWGCEIGTWNTGGCTTTPGATFSHPLTITLYNVDTGTGALGSVIATKTETFAIPYRPSANPACTDPKQWMDGSGACFNGLATPVTFSFDGTIALPEELVWGIAFNTSNYGSAPIGPSTCSASPQGCGYDSLNVGLSDAASTTTGIDVDPDGAYWNTATASYYCDGGTAGVGTFRNDTGTGCWTGYRPMARIDAVEPAAPDPDTDGDGVPDSQDNCPYDSNPTQKDRDRDHIGDACEHDAVVKRFNAGGTDIKLPRRGGSATRDVTLTIEGNHGPHGDVTRAVIEVGNLPDGCALASAGPDRRFGTWDDGPVLTSPGGVLFDVTRYYAGYQTVTFKLKVKLFCHAPVPTRSVILLKAVVDHGADDYPSADDEDLRPSNNMMVEALRIR